jgi:hypothetical protein
LPVVGASIGQDVPVPCILASDFTDHLAAWATVAAAVGTVGSLMFLLIQLTGERRARRAHDKREQAEKVSGWIASDWMHHREDGKQTLELLNASHEPVFRAVVHLVFVQGGPETGLAIDKHEHGKYRVALLVIPPGKYFVTVPEAFHGMHRRHGVELAFTDRSGVHWLRDSSGHLTEISQPPPDFWLSC